MPVQNEALRPAAARPAPAASLRLARVLVGYDASDGANAAAAFGLWLAGAAGAAVTLLHACPAPEAAASADVERAAADRLVADEGEWRRRMENLGAYVGPRGSAAYRLERGSPARALIAVARETDADLVLLGSHGRGRLRGALLGSVSAQVLAHAPCTIMLFPQHTRSEPAAHTRTVVAGIDGSPASAHALAVAQSLAAPLGARLVLLHAYDPHGPFVTEPTRTLREQVRRHARALVHEAHATVAAPLDVVEERAVEGRVREVLVAACEEAAPAILVVGDRGHGGFAELLLGGTARWVAHWARCPVVVARDRAGAV